MPLNTQILRDGEPLSLRWGGFHIAAMVVAVSLDSGQGPFEQNTLDGIVTEPELRADYPNTPIRITRKDMFSLMDYGALSCTPLGHDAYTLTGAHKFLDATDGEVLELRAGDKLLAFRN